MSNEFPLKSGGRSAANKSLSWLFGRAGTARIWIGFSVGAGLAGGVLLIAQARLLAHIVHSVVMDHTGRAALIPFFAGLAGIIALRAVLAWGREVAGFRAGATVRDRLRMEILSHLAALGPAHLAGERTGALSAAVMEQTEGVHDFFAHYLPQMALAVMIPVAILAVVFPVNWAAGTLFLFTAPMIPLFMILVGMGAESVSQRNFQALARLSAHFLDVLQGLTTLKLFDRSRAEKEAVSRVSEAFRKRTMSVLRIAFLSSAVLEFFSSLSIAMVAVYLGTRYLGYADFGSWGRPLTFAHGFFILLLAPDVYLPLRELGTHYHARAEAVGAAEEILKILSVPCPRPVADEKPWTPPGTMRISLRDLRFAYENGRRPALRGVTLDLKPGERVAVVGASGAGKTTLLNLLLGFLQPDQGEIRISGTPLSRISPEIWHRQIAWIGQNPALFHGTIRENILMDRPEADEDAVWRAAESAGVARFARHLPDGLDTRVGEQNIGLSRGQAQRVALARAWLRDAPLLLLDEPTAALDAETEAEISDALDRLSRGKTLLALTHRLTHIRRFDRIVVLAQGRIAEQGTYDDLMAAGGSFYRFDTRFPEEAGRGE
ncbi:thiol reductant ABC exporter subunit CydD [Desulfonema ishimotonii]|uniref:Thiol reductant ABC exporter subunit CydD n=1 Tax=Desulfonema ishimotonii TaxID=45657 RepID=A0A401FY83_9BACT|nr:cysteine/glutathione ABC transporter permease/ATP-binding protein CydD [Desulfonema ishimotonii]GBC61931.1 thiol reductant ABC exporter subunit CydD [Desulfonema ishimotonii]